MPWISHRMVFRLLVLQPKLAHNYNLKLYTFLPLTQIMHVYPLLKAINTEVKSNYGYWLRNNVYYLGLLGSVGASDVGCPCLLWISLVWLSVTRRKPASSMDSLSLFPQCYNYKCVAPCLVFIYLSPFILTDTHIIYIYVWSSLYTDTCRCCIITLNAYIFPQMYIPF